MVEVSEETKLAFRNNTGKKTLKVNFPDLDLTIADENIIRDSLSLHESILESDSIEFVGCISSVLDLQFHGVQQKLKNERIEVSIQCDGTDAIPLFHGIVDSVKLEGHKKYKKITAYDELYTKGAIDVAAWYNSLEFPITLKNMRDSLFNYIGLTQEDVSLPNDNIVINKEYKPQILKALIVIKAICQINGRFGIVNRSGVFSYRTLAVSEKVIEYFKFYRSLDYQEFKVRPVDSVKIRQSDDDEGDVYTEGKGTNIYIVQGNIFTYNLDSSTRMLVAKNIYTAIQGIQYHPFTALNSGYPWIECGDAVSYYINDYYPDGDEPCAEEYQNYRVFYVFSRTLKGIMPLTDEYEAEGEEYQTEFITDLQTQLDVLKQESSNIKNYVDEKINEAENTGLKVLSVTALPEKTDSNTIYLIQGEVTVS